MQEAITAAIDVKTVPTGSAGMMLHEQVASGSYGAQDFTVIRDITGLHWQVRIGDTTAKFSLNEMLQHIVETVAAPSNPQQST